MYPTATHASSYSAASPSPRRLKPLEAARGGERRGGDVREACGACGKYSISGGDTKAADGGTSASVTEGA